MLAHGHPVDHGEYSELWICAFAHSTHHVLADQPHAAVPHLSGPQLVALAVVISAPGATFTRLGEHWTHTLVDRTCASRSLSSWVML